MSTEFISMLPPPGTAVSHYNRALSQNSQKDQHIPHTFLEAMSIREAVFVDEQKFPLDHEFDADDHRSFHWVTFVSVGHSSGSPSAPDTHGKRGSTASRLAVGTVRLVPPPHPPHISPGNEQETENMDDKAKFSHHRHNSNPGIPSSFNPHKEPYAQITRLAVLPTYRKLGLAKLLMENALSWAAKHPLEIVPPMSAADREAKKMEGEANEMGEKWKGLVHVHAQKSIEGLYKKWGWEKDETMGEWEEDGVMHVGMWKRLHVKER